VDSTRTESQESPTLRCLRSDAPIGEEEGCGGRDGLVKRDRVRWNRNGLGGGDCEDEGRRDRGVKGIVVVRMWSIGDKKCVPSVIEVTTLSPQGCLI
jgi:hypothetical protein